MCFPLFFFLKYRLAVTQTYHFQLLQLLAVACPTIYVCCQTCFCPNKMTLHTSYGRLLLTAFHFHAANRLADHRNAFLAHDLRQKGLPFFLLD